MSDGQTSEIEKAEKWGFRGSFIDIWKIINGRKQDDVDDVVYLLFESISAYEFVYKL
jgi:hypothetical protein